jgi:hypothetical protein
MMKAIALGLAAVALVARLAPASAYEPATTHVGLTQRAAEAVDLHKLLVTRFGLPLGQFEPLRLSGDDARDVVERLALLDPSDALVPDKEGLPALSWLLAGSVIEEMPPIRVRHHFWDPRTGKGLDDRGFATRMWLILFGSRELGGPFDLTGRPAPEWAAAQDNELSMPRALAALERAVSARTLKERQSALARALLCLGAVLNVLEEMGSPSHVRNDFRVGHLQKLSTAAFDSGSRYEAHVARELGRLGIPAPAGPLPRHPRFVDFFRELAERTQRGFFSPGTLPPPQGLGPHTTAAGLQARMAAQAPLPHPVVKGLQLAGGLPSTAYITGDAVPLLAKLAVVDGRLELQLDSKTDAAYAQVLVPQTARSAAGLLAFLLRGSLDVARTGTVTPAVTVLRAQVTVLAEDERAERREVRKEAALTARAGNPLIEIDLGTLPAGTRKVCVVARGVDDAGEPVVLSGELTL